MGDQATENHLLKSENVSVYHKNIWSIVSVQDLPR